MSTHTFARTVAHAGGAAGTASLVRPVRRDGRLAVLLRTRGADLAFSAFAAGIAALSFASTLQLPEFPSVIDALAAITGL